MVSEEHTASFLQHDYYSKFSQTIIDHNFEAVAIIHIYSEKACQTANPMRAIIKT